MASASGYKVEIGIKLTTQEVVYKIILIHIKFFQTKQASGIRYLTASSIKQVKQNQWRQANL